jgi:hypothetical protein
MIKIIDGIVQAIIKAHCATVELTQAIACAN